MKHGYLEKILLRNNATTSSLEILSFVDDIPVGTGQSISDLSITGLDFGNIQVERILETVKTLAGLPDYAQLDNFDMSAQNLSWSTSQITVRLPSQTRTIVPEST